MPPDSVSQALEHPAGLGTDSKPLARANLDEFTNIFPTCMVADKTTLRDACDDWIGRMKLQQRQWRIAVELLSQEIPSMMSGLRVSMAMLCGVLSISPVWAQMDQREIAAKKYEAYKAKVLAGDLKLDWRDFRLSAALGEVSQGFDPQPVHDQVVEDLDAGRNAKALRESQLVIDHNMANGEGHLLAMTVLQKMGRPEEAEKQEAILSAIGQSITDSGDGSSADKAWFTVAPSETVFFLTEALGAEIKSQELIHLKGHAYDRLTVLDRKGKKQVVWFNTDTNELLKERAMASKGTP